MRPMVGMASGSYKPTSYRLQRHPRNHVRASMKMLCHMINLLPCCNAGIQMPCSSVKSWQLLT
jgi:hypothetical protein